MRNVHTAYLVPIALALVWVGTSTPAQEPEAYGDGYAVGDYARVRYHDGGLTVQRAAAWEFQPEADLNAPVFPGDTVFTGAQQRAEVELASGTLVRIDQSTEVVFQALPDPYAAYRDNTVLQLAQGVIRVAGQVDEGEEFRIETPAASIYIIEGGDFRIDVGSQGRTRVTSRWGVAEIVSEQGSVLVRGGTYTEIWPGSVPEQPSAYNSFVSDGFDRWVAERDAVYQEPEAYADAGEAYDSLPPEVRPYYRELCASGSWSFQVDYGWTWAPHDLGYEWRPYHHGSWSYGPEGYFWISREPWGWAPYHYGRWVHVSGGGWAWAPGRVFGGAWVAWSWGTAYVGWAPLGYWNRPVFLQTVHHGYYDPRSWTFVAYEHLHYKRYSRHSVSIAHISEHVKRNVVVTRPPEISPKLLSKKPEWRDEAYRRVKSDRDAGIPPVDVRSKPTRDFKRVDLDRSRKQRSSGTQGNSSGSGSAKRQLPGPGKVPGPAAPRATSTRKTQAGGVSYKKSATLPSYPRQTSSRDRKSTGTRPPSTVKPASPTKRESTTGSTTRRFDSRQMYKRMTTTSPPSSTRERVRSTTTPKRQSAGPSRNPSRPQAVSPRPPTGSRTKSSAPTRSTKPRGSTSYRPRSTAPRTKSSAPPTRSRPSTTRSYVPRSPSRTKSSSPPSRPSTKPRSTPTRPAPKRSGTSRTKSSGSKQSSGRKSSGGKSGKK